MDKINEEDLQAPICIKIENTSKIKAAVQNLTLRPATDDDLNFLYTLHRETLKESVDKTWGWDESWQKNHFVQHFDPAALQVIMVNNEDVGVLSVFETADYLVVIRIEIMPDYQNKKIGTTLLAAVISNSQEKRKSIVLQVLKVNTRARALYETLGFSVSGETATHYQMQYPLSTI